MSSNERSEYRIVLDGDDVGILGYSSGGAGDPERAQLYIADRFQRMATLPLTPDVLDALIPWLERLHQSQGSRSPQAAPSVLPSSVDIPGQVQRSSFLQRVGKGISVVSGWSLVDSWWSSTSQRTHVLILTAAVVLVVATGLIVR